MKVERDRLIAYIRIFIVICAMASICIIPAFLKNSLVLIGGIAAFVYSLVILFLIGRIDKRYLYYFSWFIDLFFAFILLFATKSVNGPFILLFLYLIFSYGLGRSLIQNLICATILSLALGFLVFLSPGIKEKVVYLIFSTAMFFIFGLIVSIIAKIEAPEEDNDLHPMPEEKMEAPITTPPEEAKTKSGPVTWNIPKTIEEAYSIIRRLKEEKDNWEKQYMDERQRGNTIRQLAHDIATQKELFSLYEDIVTATRREINSQAGFLLRLEKSRLSVKCYDGSLSEITMKMLESVEILYEMLNTGNSIRLGLDEQNVLSSALAGTHDKIKSLLCVPLKTQYDKNPFGIIGLANYQGQDGVDYSEAHEEFLRLVAIEAAVSIKNIEYLKDIEKKYDELILGLARAIEAKDDYTHDHVDRVRELSEKLARALNLPEEEVRIVKTAATLHDVGKIATPDHILKKKGALDDMEWQQMKMHTIKSRDILEGISSLEREVLNMVLLHHERFDGKGYPKGLKGDDIPMGAKIIAVADTFDAMTSDRPYRKGFPEDVALEKMKAECMGTQFDPEVLTAFLRMMSKRVISKRVKDKSKKVDITTGEAVHNAVTAQGLSSGELPSREASTGNLSSGEMPSRVTSAGSEPSKRIPPEQAEKPRRVLEIDFTKKE